MIYPTVEQLSKLGNDRYLITIATAKCARLVTDEYVRQREKAEKMIARKETDKPLYSLISEDLRDDKAVKTALKRLMNGDYTIVEGKKTEEEPSGADGAAQTAERADA